MSCLDSSRSKLFAIWLPFQTLSVVIVSYLLCQSLQLSVTGLLGYRQAHLIYLQLNATLAYFFVANVKDFSIFVYFAVWGDEGSELEGKRDYFKNALFIHLYSLLADMVVLALLCVWGEMAAKTRGEEINCELDPSCRNITELASKVKLASYLYIAVIIAKFAGYQVYSTLAMA